jgi:DNA-binding transcriptional LysR family regulator
VLRCCQKRAGCCATPRRSAKARGQYAAGEAGTLAIGFVSTAAYNVLPRIVPAFRARRPGVRLELREATSDVQAPALVAGEIDVGFLIATAVPPRSPTQRCIAKR